MICQMIVKKITSVIMRFCLDQAALDQNFLVPDCIGSG